MILGADHLSLTAIEFEKTCDVLERIGFMCLFREERLPNAGPKREFLHEYRAHHSIAYYRPRGGGISLELTVHQSEYSYPRGRFMPLIRSSGRWLQSRTRAVEEPEWETILAATPVAQAVSPAMWSEVNACVWLDRSVDDIPLSITGVLLEADDPEREIVFWRDLGLELLDHRIRACGRLFLRSPVSAWSLDLFVGPGRASKLATLDAAGFPCLALLSSNVAEDTVRAVRAGATDVTAAFKMAVNGKPLEIVLLRSPGGAICELIQIRTSQRPGMSREDVRSEVQ